MGRKFAECEFAAAWAKASCSSFRTKTFVFLSDGPEVLVLPGNDDLIHRHLSAGCCPAVMCLTMSARVAGAGAAAPIPWGRTPAAGRSLEAVAAWRPAGAQLRPYIPTWKAVIAKLGKGFQQAAGGSAR